MRTATIFLYDQEVGILEELEEKRQYIFSYSASYHGEPISLTLPTEGRSFEFDGFPPFFEGLLPEGMQLEALIRRSKIDKDDLFSQLVAVGADLVGAVSVKKRKGGN